VWQVLPAVKKRVIFIHSGGPNSVLCIQSAHGSMLTQGTRVPNPIPTVK
jgi:hypothetical protein